MQHDILSIKSAFEKKEQLEREAKAILEKLAQQLLALIPANLQPLAREKGWIKNEIDGWWKLPEFLQYLVINTRNGGCSDETYREHLTSYGFDNLEDLKAKFAELAEAWKGLVRIEIDDSEEWRVRVRYYAAEISNERKS